MDRGTYNSVVRETDQEQLLTNIVRQRYLEVTQYIQVGNLTASYSLSNSLTGNLSATTSPAPVSWNPSLSPTVSYSDTPTITYIPLSNIDFAKSLMSPVSMNNFLLLAHAGGYDHAMLFDLFFEQIGGVSGNLLNRGGVQHITPEYTKYQHIISLLEKLYRNGSFSTPQAVAFERDLGCFLHFRNHSENTRDARQLKRLLGIPLNSKDIIFMEHSLVDELKEKDGIAILSKQKTKPRNIIYVQLRSVYAIIYLLGHGVQIPSKDISHHLTRELVNKDGSLHNWSNMMKNILTIYSSEQEPLGPVLVKARIHDHWFYIKATDQASKDTFDAILRILTLTSAVAASNNSMPVLTIPVASTGK